MPAAELTHPSPISALSEILGDSVTSVERIGGGRNSQVFKVTCGHSGRYVAKLYSDDQSHGRDRLNVEFSSLQFMIDNGVECVPRPIAVEPTRRYVVYEYVDGERIGSEKVTAADVGQCVEFLLNLKGLTDANGSSELPAAAEACFSVQEALDNIEDRMGALLALPVSDPQHLAMSNLLTDEFSATFADVREACRSADGGLGRSLTDRIEPEHRTLSPSDFGFHNALRRPDGRIVFFDFEYFGWDDPAKMVVDFLLHPGMDLSRGLKQRFLASMLGGLRDDPGLEARVELVYPLFALKWCLILLNEFLPKYMERRALASAEPVDVVRSRSLQLSKARRMIESATTHGEAFAGILEGAARHAG